ncbi:NAD-dependent epimerase/dehydratase family protein [Roseivivax sp. GX 12232]|uniref:NAD-dependent epimerase/dehydratase family protein n=1 Tax=Roseivivax sp. GX 12232 TaxID=2900547 RepID=UPI001E507D26|nr:NAD-dependent epimerase/dehydratase family protein [Roseivivax sp. GX 12232]MCE0506471.1 NAD-dependent epimerase/dehydratase family protein [Roseivivax sp. GX 12232]
MSETQRDPVIDTEKPVLVTGATGYVAGWIVQRLLQAGATVHAPIRDPERAEKTRHLDALAEDSPGTIRYFKADLLEDGSYAEAMAGCGVVFHTASPFTSDFEDPQRDLVDPALEGTRNVLTEAAKTESVTRVVVTSSCAAIYTDNSECAAAPGGVLTEDVWNTSASLEYQPYNYSKTVAEREAWAIAESQDGWRLVTVNPSLVIGPAIGGKPTSESFTIMERLGTGEFKQGAPRLGIGMVDVRDVADAHIAAGFLPEAQGRHITSGHDTDLYAASQELVGEFGDRFPLPGSAAPKWLVWLIAPKAGLERGYVARNVGVPFRADNSKSRQALGVSYRPLGQSMREMFDYMIEEGYFTRV